VLFRSHAAASAGKLNQARELYRQASELDQRYGLKERAAGTAAAAAATEAECGNSGRAREQAAIALAMARGPGVEGGAARALALAGDIRQAQALADDLAKRFPLHTLLNAVQVPMIRASIEIERTNPARAIELLAAAAPYEFGFGELGAIYLRGRAYVRMGKGNEAAAEFQKILDHRGVFPVAPVHALAHLGLARAYVVAGDAAKSRKAYQDFLALWKDADPDIPILQQAKAEFAKLK